MPNPIKDLVDNPHPIYQNYSAFWRFLLDSYEGGVDYTNSQVNQITNKDGDIIQVKVNGTPLSSKRNSNLFKHKKELESDYAERVNMSYYYNFCAPIIDIYTNHLLRDSVMDDWGNIEKAVDIRKDNIDRKGSSLDEFRREMAELSQIYGHVYILTDKPKTEREMISLADQMENDMFPYCTFFHPTDVINWALDEFGHLYWVLLKETYNGNIDPLEFDKNKMQICQYRIWTRTEWILFDAGFQEIDRGSHNLGKVPLDIVYNKQSKKYRNNLGISEIADISFIARDVYNKCSELNEIIRNQTFSLLTLQGKASDYDELSVGTSKALLYPPDSNTPQYISPAAENAQTLMDQIDRQVHKMFQLAKLEGGNAIQREQIDSQSGISKAFDFQETNSALAKKAGHMEDGESRIWDTFARWEGQQSFEGSISYSRDFNIQELNDDLDEAQKLLNLQLGEMFNKEVKKEIIKKKFPRIPDEEMDKMMADLDKQQQTEGTSLRARLPNLFGGNGGKNNQNAQPGGINREFNNGRRNQ